MISIDEFMKQVFTNLTKNNVNIQTHNTISFTQLEKGIMQYFGLLHEKSAKSYIKKLTELQYIEHSSGGFKFTDYALKKFGGK